MWCVDHTPIVTASGVVVDAILDAVRDASAGPTLRAPGSRL
jgi:hypothetical protein